MSNRGIMVFYKSLLSAAMVWALTGQSGATLGAIKLENIGANLSATPEGLRLTWDNPDDDFNPWCYESTVRFKTTCDPNWENVTLAKFSYVLRTSRREDYHFQLCMRYSSKCNPSLNTWTSWTRTLSLGNANDTECSSGEEPPAQPFDTLSLLTALPVLLCLLLLCSLTHERVRRHFLPIVPEPKPRLGGLLKMEHCTDPESECEVETVDIEIVDSERREGGPGEEKLLENNMEAHGDGVKESWAPCSLTEAELQGYPTLPNSGAYITYNGMHPE